MRQQAPFDPNLSRITASLGLDRQEVVGEEVRIPMARDGHFWATVRLNGTERRMLVDRGATVTALSVRKSVVSGKSVSVRVDFGGRRLIKKKNTKIQHYTSQH